MSDRESLSALLDGEADELELRRFLKAAESDPALLDTWERMSLVQSLLHDDNLKATTFLRKPGSGIAAAVDAVLAAEPPVGKASPGAWKSAAKIAIAASVAIAVFAGLQAGLRQDAGTAPVPVALEQGSQLDENRVEVAGLVGAGNGAQAGDSSVADAAARQGVDPAARQRLEEYIRSVSITREEPAALEQLQDSPLYRLVNEIIKPQ